jgi:hypothetical protein
VPAGYRVSIVTISERKPFRWKGDPEVSDPGVWDNDDGPEDWYAVSDDDGIHVYTSSEVLAWFLTGLAPTLNMNKAHRKDPLYVVGPLPLSGRAVPGDVTREPDGWWRVESSAGVGIAYAGTEDKAQRIASFGPMDP